MALSHPPLPLVVCRHRFAPSCQSLGAYIGARLAENSSFTLSSPISSLPPFHAALACLAVMPRWGLHLVPNNLSDILSDHPRVDRMYEPGASFSLDLLVDAVTTSRPHMVRSRHFFWSEVSWRYGKKNKAETAKAELAGNATSANADNARPPPIVSVRRVSATSQPPLRSWDKPTPPLSLLDLQAKKWKHGSGSQGGEGRQWSSPRTSTESHDGKKPPSRRQRQSAPKACLPLMALSCRPLCIPRPVLKFC